MSLRVFVRSVRRCTEPPPLPIVSMLKDEETDRALRVDALVRRGEFQAWDADRSPSACREMSTALREGRAQILGGRRPDGTAAVRLTGTTTDPQKALDLLAQYPRARAALAKTVARTGGAFAGCSTETYYVIEFDPPRSGARAREE